MTELVFVSLKCIMMENKTQGSFNPMIVSIPALVYKAEYCAIIVQKISLQKAFFFFNEVVILVVQCVYHSFTVTSVVLLLPV